MQLGNNAAATRQINPRVAAPDRAMMTGASISKVKPSAAAWVSTVY
jgi:hypothetical protein